MVLNGPASRERKPTITDRRREHAVCASVFRPRSTRHVENIAFALFEKRNHFSELKRDGTRLFFDNVKILFFFFYRVGDGLKTLAGYFFFTDVLIPTTSLPTVDRIPWVSLHGVYGSVKGVIIVRLKSRI